MIITRYKCEVCGKETNGDSLGYEVTNQNNEIFVEIGKPDKFDKHTCGSACATKVFGTAVQEWLKKEKK